MIKLGNLSELQYGKSYKPEVVTSKRKHCRKFMVHLGFDFYRCKECDQDFVIRKNKV